MERMNTYKIAQELEGINTIKTVQEKYGVSRNRAIYLIYRLRKDGFVCTSYQSNKVRFYRIYTKNAAGGISYLDIINKNSPIKLFSSNQYYLHGREASIEEVLVYAVSQKTIRFLIASISLFRKVRSWSKLYKLAKEADLVREIAALYDLARLYLPKLRRMPERFRNLALPKKSDKYRYIIRPYSSIDFKDLEKKWKVYIPMNLSDLYPYKGIFT